MKVLMVCLGNICRSPLAEGILRSKAQKYKLDILVDSAGTIENHIGENPDPRSVTNAKKHGIDISKLIARKFSVKDFDAFNRIYVMDTSNYAHVIKYARNQEDKNKVNLILNELAPAVNKPVPDPYFGGETGFEQVFNLLDEACEKICHNIKNNA